ncbi:MAG: ATP-binding protein, partial [Umezawaea sp.]
EQDEQDPDQLASLFELDHLATRMRRNSENLLVLSGTDLSRRLTRPVPAAEVLGAAVSEVEQYVRVQVGQTPELTVQGRAVQDLLHLIAELLDNATAFSSPESKVRVSTAITRRGELAIEIQDCGIGMPEQELRDANNQLADPPDVDAEISRRMGLYVVARLSKRHGITVRLRANEDVMGGTTAHVLVPAPLVRRSHPPTTVAGPVTDSTTGTNSDTPPPVDLFEAQTPVDLQPLVRGASRRAHRRRARMGAGAGLIPPPLARQLQDEADWVSSDLSSSTGVESPTLRMPAVERMPAWFRHDHPIDEDPPVAPAQTPAATLAHGHATAPRVTEGAVLVHPAEAGPGRLARPHPRQRPPRTGPEPADFWSSGGDEGQAVADCALTASDTTATATGLPKREPRARLIPGAAAPPPMAEQAVPLDPDAMRTRLESFQQGVSRGRHERIGSLTVELPPPGPSDQETP